MSVKQSHLGVIESFDREHAILCRGSTPEGGSESGGEEPPAQRDRGIHASP
ncbi:MAG TPA: hypothetical protein VLM40_12355 [Gemmata sp.]|nr:hypothetical protein [Gemmata sp.]